MGPVGSRLPSGPPSGEGPSGKSRSRNRALTIIIVALAVICGMIAWSQWYAIHVNVPKYQAQHANAPHH
jgi:hypothetical protein